MKEAELERPEIMKDNAIIITCRYKVLKNCLRSRIETFCRYQGGGGYWDIFSDNGNKPMAWGSISSEKFCSKRIVQKNSFFKINYLFKDKKRSFGDIECRISSMLPFFNEFKLEEIAPKNNLARVLSARGPHLGIDSLWKNLKIRTHSPLIGGIIKPSHCSLKQIKEIAIKYAEAGCDIIKDDELPSEKGVSVLKRIDVIGRTLADYTNRQGKKVIYLVNGGTIIDDLLKITHAAKKYNGSVGLMMLPGLVGFDVVALIREKSCGIPIALHPANINPWIDFNIQFGLLGRLAGADILIGPAPGSPLNINTWDDATTLIRYANSPLLKYKKSLVAFSGGLDDRVASKVAKELGTRLGFFLGSWFIKNENNLTDSVNSLRFRSNFKQVSDFRKNQRSIS